MEKIVSTWAGLASLFIGECFDASKPFLDKDYDGIDPYVRFVNTQLYIDCHLSSESSLLLVREGKEWDAEIINRSVMEGSIKYVYLMIGSIDEIREKAVEFWETLPRFSAAKRSKVLKSFLGSGVIDPKSPEWLPLHALLIPDEEIEQTRSIHNKKKRQQIEQKWSFSGITKDFLKSDSEGLRLLVHLAHGYGMSSHLIHKDGEGVGMVWERYARDPIRQRAVRLGHSARIISDICTFSEIRLLYLLKACKQKSDIISEIEKKHDPLFNELREAGKNFTSIEYQYESTKNAINRDKEK